MYMVASVASPSIKYKVGKRFSLLPNIPKGNFVDSLQTLKRAHELLMLDKVGHSNLWWKSLQATASKSKATAGKPGFISLIKTTRSFLLISKNRHINPKEVALTGTAHSMSRGPSQLS